MSAVRLSNRAKPGWRAGSARSALQAAAAWLTHLDRATIEALPRWRRPAGVAVARAVSAVAEPAFIGPVLAVAAVAAGRRRGWRAVCLPAVAVPAGALARRLASDMIARPRPPEALWLTSPEGHSLPSRHSTMAALAAGACVGLGVTGRTRHAATLLSAVTVGTSRVYLGVHWPSDVLAGWLFAEAWLSLADRITADG